MRTFLLMLPLIGVQMISSNFFTAIGKAYKGALLALMRSVFCFVPIVLILPHFLGITGILCTAPIADFLACLVVVCFITNEMKNLENVEFSRFFIFTYRFLFRIDEYFSGACHEIATFSKNLRFS